MLVASPSARLRVCKGGAIVRGNEPQPPPGGGLQLADARRKPLRSAAGLQGRSDGAARRAEGAPPIRQRACTKSARSAAGRKRPCSAADPHEKRAQCGGPKAPPPVRQRTCMKSARSAAGRSFRRRRPACCVPSQAAAQRAFTLQTHAESSRRRTMRQAGRTHRTARPYSRVRR